ncbi:MAG TPA: hypothetical protein VJB96_00780 [Patescibacteria group bacterium]|nr:hypothetical protein [Patescibacteria group bacterium]
MPRFGLIELVEQSAGRPDDPNRGRRIAVRVNALLHAVEEAGALFAYQIETWTPERLNAEIYAAQSTPRFRVEKKEVPYEFESEKLTAQILFVFGKSDRLEDYKRTRNSILEISDLPLLQ